jgi:hypothetical protein
MKIIYPRPGIPSWHVITVMVRLLARLTEAELVVPHVDDVRGSARRYAGLLPRRRGKEPLLVVAPEPVDLNAALHLQAWTKGYGPVVGWVIDSWWDDRIPACAKRGFYDLIYVTEQESVEPWREATGADVRWLPQGSNVLDWGSASSDRPVTLQRVGRQPAAWDDDDATALECERMGLTYAGRPAFRDGAEEGMADLLAALGRARFSLAFSSKHDPQAYTHPTREYVTGRWTDSLAAGAVVAGIPPVCASTRELFWPGALLDLGSVDRDEGLARIASADAEWTPEVAAHNHLMALRRLDWRWRAKTLAEDLGLTTGALESELESLQRRITALESAGPG